MKQFKLMKGVVKKLREVSDLSGAIDDLTLYKEADEMFWEVKRLLSDIDEGTSELVNMHQHERDSSGSCIGSSHLNFYNDESEAQELILDEDRLTSRSQRKGRRHDYDDSYYGKYYKNDKLQKKTERYLKLFTSYGV
mmetsp:Transcript_22010/g.21742  ORF Transcript_22010/g.21742 Transcript_22010/m.21742 type:complete len:137 (+) Transcript_22010:247-657(+)|eukprot:CAMPEP_0197001242 /NCGR_PEP_ID=MMETSP1380-20130617/5980_1 /TAXON_ID=5936 /ORGANISM="Euplotes crassus, Strain CT5" /LENGTH=136 /DNA_ID=CAMNT_0042418825 /DNA_START=185 /DNA_END=595 /DNA_ORIENTATION=+